MKTKEELNALKEEVETMNRKLAKLTEEELAEVVGGKRPLYTRCWFSVADMEEYPGQIKVRVIRESNDQLLGHDNTVRITTNYPLSGDE